MKGARRRYRALVALLAGLLAGAFLPEARAYIEAPHSLGKIVNLCTNVVLLRVEKVDREKNLILFRKVRDIKGLHSGEVVKHNIGRRGRNPGEWRVIMEWAEVGKTAIFFHNGGMSVTCIGHAWYQSGKFDAWWTLIHGEPFLPRTYCGPTGQLADLVTEMLQGKEVVLPCLADGSKDDLLRGRGRIQRMKASLTLDYDARRDFVGWGGEAFRRLDSMAGFTHSFTLPGTSPDAQAVCCLDVNGDGKPDVCLVGSGRLLVLKNVGDSLDTLAIPGLPTGCRAAAWADYNGDGKPDLLLATPAGPKLYTNLGNGTFRDDSNLLPRQPGWDLTAAVWIDCDGDGKPDILLANGFHGLVLFRNKGPASRPAFEDVSEAVGLGPNGVGSTVKGDSLTVCDVDGDGRPDFLYGAGKGVLVLNMPRGFIQARDCGISFRAGQVRPAFGDYDHDGLPDLFVPQKDGGKLFHNEGGGHFRDVTAQAGLGRFPGWATSAAWGDVDGDGNLDLVVGCLRGPNRFFRNKGGTFEDASEAAGLNRRVFNTQAVALADLNGDGVLDVVFNNEGQESCVLLGKRGWSAGPPTGAEPGAEEPDREGDEAAAEDADRASPDDDPTGAASRAAALVSPMPERPRPVGYFRVTLPEPFARRRPLRLAVPAEDGVRNPARREPPK
jgi:hypothetical protein